MNCQDLTQTSDGCFNGRDKPVRCVAGALIRDGKILLVKRSPQSRFYPDVWDLFGGHVEGEETLEDALYREAFEELRVKVERLYKIGTFYDPVERAEISVFVVRGWVGEPTNAELNEHSEIRWFTLEELPISVALDGYGDLIKRAVAVSLDDTTPSPSEDTGEQQ